jgi:hypothetical protein
MPIPYYPLFNRRIDKRWTLHILADQQGNVEIGMSWTYGVFDLTTLKIQAKPTKIPNKALHEINQILREVSNNAKVFN